VEDFSLLGLGIARPRCHSHPEDIDEVWIAFPGESLAERAQHELRHCGQYPVGYRLFRVQAE